MIALSRWELGDMADQESQAYQGFKPVLGTGRRKTELLPDGCCRTLSSGYGQKNQYLVYIEIALSQFIKKVRLFYHSTSRISLTELVAIGSLPISQQQ